MRLPFGLEIKRATALSTVDSRRGWWPIFESFTGAWQKNIVVDKAAVTAYWAVFACATLIASDISKLPPRVMERRDGIWRDTLMRPVLRKPNRYQTRIEFFSTWVFSQLFHGNTYVLKQRNREGHVEAMYILDPCRVQVLVAPDGSVFYQLSSDNMSGLKEDITVPASEIIHDRMYTIHHPLVGVSPIYACGVAAMQGIAIQNNSESFFGNMSRPSGILVAPGNIDPEKAKAIGVAWNANYSGPNAGKVAVIGDGLKYEAMSMNATDSQLIEQLKMTAEMICACFHVPGYKIGVGQMPTVNNTAALNQQYYDQCLQYLIEKMELRLDEGLELDYPFECWFDLSGLLRMDPEARYKSHNEAIKGGWKSPNEARREEDLPDMEGGNTPYMQQQNYSLAALDRRDQRDAEGAIDIQAEAMNGAQVTSLQGLITAAAAGQLPKETAAAAIAAAFPLLSTEQINAMIAPLGAPTPAQIEADPVASADEVVRLLQAIQKGFEVDA